MIDARGLLCPMPVVKVQQAVKATHPDTLEVLVDDPCAVEEHLPLRRLERLHRHRRPERRGSAHHPHEEVSAHT